MENIIWHSLRIDIEWVYKETLRAWESLVNLTPLEGVVAGSNPAALTKLNRGYDVVVAYYFAKVEARDRSPLPAPSLRINSATLSTNGSWVRIPPSFTQESCSSVGRAVGIAKWSWFNYWHFYRINIDCFIKTNGKVPFLTGQSQGKMVEPE